MATTTIADEDDTYIDYDAFLTPQFSAHSFANTLILGTNVDPSDPTLDLTTPLSRVLFDLQEIDTHIHALTTASALPLLSFTATSRDASESVLAAVDAQLDALKTAHERLRRDVADRSHVAGQVLVAVERLHAVTTQLRELGRALVVARQIEVQMQELGRGGGGGGGGSAGGRGDGGAEYNKALVRVSHNIRELRLGRVLADVDDDVILAQDLKKHVFVPAETAVLAKARDAVLAFEPVAPSTAASGNGTSNGNGSGGTAPTSAAATSAFGVGVAGGAGAEVMRARAAAGVLALYLLSREEAVLLTNAVQTHLNSAVNASLTALTRSLTALTTLDRSVGEVAARCQNLVALQALLSGIPVPTEDIADDQQQQRKQKSLLDPVLTQLDSGGGLPSIFFRSLAAGIEPRVREVAARGGANARILKGAKDRVRNAFRACVERGLVGAAAERGAVEFEVAVMVGAAGALGR
ncbi:Golgi transport complex subunit 5-domain-containing protein [Tricharina praecox]|uniref:Golgi transport complex subunit 5-domain-containing protein n=1 Tax=Tricharina praecox TaxID=43433 RepID=UPI0022210644|nr:Golgi transport complex subunit 5-domain-containing protein [Tricharina praecox]XP_051343655.1 Golgi transport complex subunit 5-domain-containing protein [Tricharina praecox]KAI5841283.1 Golgi transport complex subunit 5-domain-containing protein [Tricharina praecox]KAI5857909.1 Golgi transport complex subunit 5-domain-containing protein [Tricharina praecox]